MRLKAIADHNRVVRLEDWNGLDLAGNNDCASIVNAAMTQAAAAGFPVSVPACQLTGGIRLATSVEYKAPLIGSATGFGDYAATSVFLPGMSDGSAVFYTTNREGFHVENIFIKGVLGAGPGYSKTNCVGFAFGDTSWVPADGAVETVDASRGYMSNTYVYGCAIGYQMLGWIPTFKNIYARLCGLGFAGRFLNAGNLDLVTERCGVAFELSDTYGLFIPRLLDEGPSEYRTGPSRIDKSFGVTIGTYYTEGSKAAWPWLIVGGREPNSYSATVIPIVMRGTVASSTQLADISAPASGDTWYIRTTESLSQYNGAAWIGLGKGGVSRLTIESGTVGEVTGSAPIVVDYSSGHAINVDCSNATTYTPPFEETANARACASRALRVAYGQPSTNLANGAGLQAAALYLNPNPLMDGVRYGAKDCYASNVTAASESTIARCGAPGLRITATSAGTYNGFRMAFTDAWVARIAAKGTGFTVGAWVWIPDTAGMGSADTGTTYKPRIALNSVDGAVAADTQSFSIETRRNAWNFLRCYQVPQTDAVELRIMFYANYSANTPPGDGSVYIVVDEMYIAEGDCWELMAEGKVQRSSECSGTVEGGVMKLHVTAALAATMIADTTQTYKTGDAFEYTDPVLGGVKGIVCTTAGAGGTAVFKDFGVIAS